MKVLRSVANSAQLKNRRKLLKVDNEFGLFCGWKNIASLVEKHIRRQSHARPSRTWRSLGRQGVCRPSSSVCMTFGNAWQSRPPLVHLCFLVHQRNGERECVGWLYFVVGKVEIILEKGTARRVNPRFMHVYSASRMLVLPVLFSPINTVVRSSSRSSL